MTDFERTETTDGPALSLKKLFYGFCDNHGLFSVVVFAE
jgi:hypothetical protein